MGHIRIGATSWTDKTLLESGFYPRGVKSAEERLRHYASLFPIVEVDSSYYAIPAPQNAALWAERTPPGFVFDVKAFRALTLHQTPFNMLPPDLRKAMPASKKANVYLRDLPTEIIEEIWKRFRASLDPLRRAGKLGAVVFQFAPWIVYRPSHLDYLAECKERMGVLRMAVEFRNKTWLSERHQAQVLDFERRHGLIHVVTDEPQGFASSVPTVWEATDKALAIVRLHGRNAETWEKKLTSAAERFNYSYSEAELRELIAPVQKLAGETDDVHVLFNNCYGDRATRNASQLTSLTKQLSL